MGRLQGLDFDRTRKQQKDLEGKPKASQAVSEYLNPYPVADTLVEGSEVLPSRNLCSSDRRERNGFS